jgi:hypothetical protein
VSNDAIGLVLILVAAPIWIGAAVAMFVHSRRVRAAGGSPFVTFRRSEVSAQTQPPRWIFACLAGGLALNLVGSLLR